MKKSYLLIVVLVTIICKSSLAQNTAMAKAEYQLAEQAYTKADYLSALEHVKAAAKNAGKENQLTLYLRVLAVNEITNNNSAYVDTLNNSLKQFYDDPISKKLDAQRYSEVENIKKLAVEKEATKKAKTMLFTPVRTFCSFPFTVGLDLAGMEKIAGSKKVKSILKQKMLYKLNMTDFNLEKGTSYIYSDPTYLVTAKDITAITGISCTGSNKTLFNATDLTLAGIMVNEKSKIMAHVYTAVTSDKSDIEAAIFKDLGAPFATIAANQDKMHIWIFGTLYVLHMFTEGEHAVTIYDTATFYN